MLFVAAAVFIFHETRGTTFADDEWTWVLQRRGGGLHSFLDPHNDHLSLVSVSIYKLLFSTVGLRTYTPYSAIAVTTHLLCSFLLFVYARPRVGPYFACLATALILFFGPGWQEFLWAFQMAWLFAVAAGIGALLLLDRQDRIGDVGACTLLGVALASAGPGVAVAIGLVVEVLQRRRPRDLWIAGIPIALYGLWWLTYQGRVYSSPIGTVPAFVFHAAAGAMSSLTGLSAANALTSSGHFVGPGTPLLVVALLLLAWRLYRMGRVPPRLLTLLVTLLSFWITAGVGRAYVTVGPLVFKGTGYESRYLYVSVILILLIAIEAGQHRSAPNWIRALTGVAVLAALYSNVGSLREGSQAQRNEGQLDRASLGTLDMTRAIVKPDFVPVGFDFGIVTADEYFAAERSLGSPSASPAQIATLPDWIRFAADGQLIRIHQISLKPIFGAAARGVVPQSIDRLRSGQATPPGRCVTYRVAPSTETSASAFRLTVPSRGVVLAATGRGAVVGIRRFSARFQPIGTLSNTGPAVLRISPDHGLLPWRIQISTSAPTVACRLG